jgi:hypothetical protein
VHGPTCIFWANLTPFTLKLLAAKNAGRDLRRKAAGFQV